MRRGRVVIGLLLGTAVSVVVLTGCGGSSGGGTTGGGSSSDLADKSPTEILTLAKAAVKEAGTYRIASTGSQFAGQSFSLTVRVNDDKQTASGVATVRGIDIHFIKAGGAVYVKAPRAFFSQLGLTQKQVDAASGRWIKAPVSDPNFGQFAAFTDADSYLSPTTPVTKGDETTVDGYQVIALQGDLGRLYIRSEGPPLPVRLESKSSSGGGVTFTDFGKPVTVTAPAKSVDVADVQQAGQ